MQIIENFRVILDFQVEVDESTGEITTKCVKKSIDKTNFEVSKVTSKKKAKKEEVDTPQITLEENKLNLNSAAISLMGVVPDDKLDVKYEMIGNTLTPVIEKDIRIGNKLTKSHTIAYRGNKREELLKYGTVFDLVPHETQAGRFILKGDSLPEPLKGDENISLDNIDDDLPFDTSLIDDSDAKIEEIDASFFKF